MYCLASLNEPHTDDKCSGQLPELVILREIESVMGGGNPSADVLKDCAYRTVSALTQGEVGRTDTSFSSSQ